jgi:hypothetical protein
MAAIETEITVSQGEAIDVMRLPDRGRLFKQEENASIDKWEILLYTY